MDVAKMDAAKTDAAKTDAVNMNPSKSDASKSDVTALLIAWSEGDEEALERLLPLVHNELRRLARIHLRRERQGHTLQPTALVNEAYLRIVDQNRVQWQSRVQFFAICSRIMRRVLVDHARRRLADKRDGQRTRVTLDEDMAVSGRRELDVLAVNEALTALEEIDPEQGRLVELKFFADLTIDEIAEVMGVSASTVKREWRMAKAWLHRELTRGGQA